MEDRLGTIPPTLPSSGLFVAIALLLGSLGPSPALAQTGIPYTTLRQDAALDEIARDRDSEAGLVLYQGEGHTVRMGATAGTVFLADPAIADVQIASADTAFVFGKQPGRTTLFALGLDGSALLSTPITVRPYLEDLAALLEAETGVRTIKAAYNRTGLVLTGTVPTPETAAAARDIATEFLGTGGIVLNRLAIAGKTQVDLRVQIAEVSRNVTRELGFDWNAVGELGDAMIGLSAGQAGLVLQGALGGPLGGMGHQHDQGSATPDGSAVEGLIDALAGNGLIKLLAKPNLTARSGETATFRVGGEFPVPVTTGEGVNRTVTTQFREFGVSLEFTPTVLSENLITIQVRPEVSELTSQGSFMVDGFSIPGVSTRSVSTTVDLGSGQSFAIAGLMRNNRQSTVQKVPGLGDLPILGPLFQSTRFQRDETELIIVVTPYIVRPATSPDQFQLPPDVTAEAGSPLAIVEGEGLPLPPRRAAPGSHGVYGERAGAGAGAGGRSGRATSPAARRAMSQFPPLDRNGRVVTTDAAGLRSSMAGASQGLHSTRPVADTGFLEAPVVRKGHHAEPYAAPRHVVPLQGGLGFMMQ